MSTGAIEHVRRVATDDRPLIAHLMFKFDTGGLENGVVNLVNRMPQHAYRHVIVALRDVSDFRLRVRRDDVGFVSMHKPPGHGAGYYAAFVQLMKELRPAVLHSRNLGALEMQPAAWWSGVPARIHGEHGRDLDDLDGNNKRMQWVRRLYAPFVHRYIALSQDLSDYLSGRVGIAPRRISQIYNGVDVDRFCSGPPGQAAAPPGCPFDPGAHWLVGTVGRMQGVKHQTLLVRAFARALALAPAMRETARLVLVGDGPLRADCTQLLQQGGVQALAWLPGERSDVPDIMRSLSCFVLPSLAEGISNTILEAMACSLPVVATAVGGNAELVRDGETGWVVPSDDVEAMANALVHSWQDSGRSQAMGRAGRDDVDRKYSLQAMVAAYQQVYDEQLAAARQGH